MEVLAPLIATPCVIAQPELTLILVVFVVFGAVHLVYGAYDAANRTQVKWPITIGTLFFALLITQ